MGIILPMEEMWDRPLGGLEKSHQVPHWFGNIAYGIVGSLFKVIFRYRVDGRENLRAFKDQCGVVLIANHTSFLDVVFIYLAARPSQWVRLMGRDTLFDNAHGLLGQILSRVGAFPVKRDSADRTSIKRAVRMLADDEIVGILPEGTRRGKGNREPELHAGAAFIARRGSVPLLPMTVRNAENVKRKGELIRFPKITIEYGTPVLLEDFDFLPRQERLDACVWYVMRQCHALSQQISPEDVRMDLLFPHAKDYSTHFAEHPIPVHDAAEVAAAFKQAKAERAANALKKNSSRHAHSASNEEDSQRLDDSHGLVETPDASEPESESSSQS